MLNQQFSKMEVIEMAKDIEKRGLNFYRSQADKTDNQEIRELFLRLAGDEKDHFQRFDNLGKSIKENSDYKEDHVYNEQVSTYLNALVEFAVFPGDELIDKEFDSMEEVLKLAIQAEKDSILLYTEMLDNHSGDTIDIIKKLIDEEKQHLLDLVKLDAKL